MKKVIAMLLTATLLFTALCTSLQAAPNDLPGNNMLAKASASTTKKSLNVLMWARDVADFPSMTFYKELEEKTGIHAELNVVNGADWSTKTNLMLASGEYPDIILRGGVDEEMYGVDQKILLPIDDYIDQYMPNYAERLSFNPDMVNHMRKSDGKMYRFGWLVPQNINVSAHLFVNKLWLDNLNLETPTTLQEYEDMLIAFRDNDPNGNEQNDEIPFTGTRSSSVDGTLKLLSFWGIPYDPRLDWLYIDDDDQVQTQLLHSDMREALITLNKWYSSNLMDIECIAQDTTEFEAKVNAGNVGSFWRWRMKAMGTDDNVIEQYACIVPVAAEPDITPQVPGYLELPSVGAMLTIGCKDIETACRWIDAQYEPETMFDGYHGYYETRKVNGADTVCGWKYNEDNGKVDFFYTDLPVAPNQSAIYFFSGAEYFSLVNLPPQRIEKIEYCEMYNDAGVVEKNTSLTLTDICRYTLDELDRKDYLKAEINKYAEEAIISFITQGVTDSSWNTFLKTLQNLKVNEYIELNQNVYNRYLSALE